MGLQYALEMQTKCKYSTAFQRQKDCFSKTNQMDKQPCILNEIKLIYITVFERQTKWIHSTVFQQQDQWIHSTVKETKLLYSIVFQWQTKWT